MKNFVQHGKTLLVPAAAAAYESGDIVTVGATAGIAAGKTAIGDDVVVNMEGVFAVPKVASGAITQGAKVYVISGQAGTTVGSNVFLGYAWDAAADGAGNVNVRLAR